ncbi:unnamed protein product [Anisakis simplex]|uniref:FABP domain-containing protein n=1 Tax=Anisakis simplex TaxID=6269 RepID=A0A0M3JTT7_ANISI|nr:unnamed protein product [Anisakis simplex]
MLKAVYIFVVATVVCINAKKMPDKYFGTYKLERSNNLEEYLIARGYRWFSRRLIMLASITKVIRKATSGMPLRYDMDTLTWKKNVYYRDFVLGRQFESEGLEEGLFKVTMDLKNGTDILTENVIRVGDPDDNETFEYTRDGNYLIMVSDILLHVVRALRLVT